MKKLLILALCTFSFGAVASTKVQSVNIKDGVFKDSLDSAQLVADFNQCKILTRGVVDDSAETIDCVPGQQFSVLWGGEEGYALATFAKMGNKAAMSQTRVGNYSFIKRGFNVGFVATIPAK